MILKTSNPSRHLLVLSLLMTVAARAALVLTIDISNPAAVVITGVANPSQVAGNLQVNFDGGISLSHFFTQNESITVDSPLAIGGNLTARGALASYNEMVTFVFGDPAVVPGVDLSIYNASAPPSDDQNLVNTAPPFTGTAVVNMAAFTHLPAVGATGNVNLGFLPSQGGVIGQWLVVPEPSAALLCLSGSLTLLLRRRRQD